MREFDSLAVRGEDNRMIADHIAAAHRMDADFLGRTLADNTFASVPCQIASGAITMSIDERVTLARWFWTEINLVNLIDHIDPARASADLVLHLGEDHCIAV